MKGSLSHEHETGIPAEDVWQVYGTPKLGDLIPQLLPQVAKSTEFVEGDGGVGSVLLTNFAPGLGMEYYKEKFIKLDNESYVKEALGVEGGFLTVGFVSYLFRFEIVPRGIDSSIIRTTIEYETDDTSTMVSAFLNTDLVAAIANAITVHLKEQKKQAEESK